MIVTHITDIGKILKLVQGQGHKVKGKNQICSYVKTLFYQQIMKGRLDV